MILIISPSTHPRVDGAPDLGLSLTLTGACCAATPLPEPVAFK